MQVFLIVRHVEGERPGEVLAHKAVDEELADQLFQPQHFLHTQEHQFFTLGEAPQMMQEGVVGAGLVEPEVHEVQRVDEDVQPELGVELFQRLEQVGRVREHIQHVLFREHGLKAAVQGEGGAQAAAVVGHAQAQVAVAVEDAVRHAHGEVRDQLHHEHREGDELGRIAVQQAHGDKQNGMDEQDERQGEQGAQGVDVQASGGKALKGVRSHLEQAAGQPQNKVRSHRGRDDVPAHAELEHLPAQDGFEEHHGKAVEHQRGIDVRPRHIAFPVQERRTVPAAVAQHGLHDIAHRRDEEPQRRAQPRQHPRLREQEGEEGGQEADEEAQGVGETGIQVMHLLAGGKLFLGGRPEAVGEDLVVAAQRDDIAAGGILAGGDTAPAVVADHGIAGKGLPFAFAALAEMPQAGNVPQEAREGRNFLGAEAGRIGYLLLQLGADGQEQMGRTAGVVQFAAGAAGQGLGVGKAHAEARARAAGGVRSQRGAQFGRAVVAAEHGQVLQDDAHLAQARGFLDGVLFRKVACFAVMRRGRSVAQHGEDDMLEAGHGTVVDGVLELVDLLDGLHIAVLPVLEVEELKVRDAALAVPQQFEHVFGRELGKVQDDARAGIQPAQLLEQVEGRQVQEFRAVRRIAGALQMGGFRAEMRIVEPGEHGLDGEVVQRFQRGLRFDAAAFGQVGLGKGVAQGGGAMLHEGEDLLVDEFRQMLERGLPAPHEGHEFVAVQRVGRAADERGKAQAFGFVPDVEDVQDAPFQPARGRAAFLHQARYLGLGKEIEEIFGVGDVARYPDEVHKAAPERRVEKQAYAHVQAHDLGGAQEFAGGFG